MVYQEPLRALTKSLSSGWSGTPPSPSITHRLPRPAGGSLGQGHRVPPSACKAQPLAKSFREPGTDLQAFPLEPCLPCSSCCDSTSLLVPLDRCDECHRLGGFKTEIYFLMISKVGSLRSGATGLVPPQASPLGL